MKELAKKDLVEGEEAFKRFDKLVGNVMSVSREELLRRVEAHKQRAAASGKKRGPKPKLADAMNARKTGLR